MSSIESSTAGGLPAKPVPRLAPSEIAALGLSTREVEILHLIGEGLSTVQVARRLHIGTNTVKTHTRQLFKRLDVSSRLEAAVWLWSRPTA